MTASTLHGPERRAGIYRRSRETEIALELALEPGAVRVDTGLGFLDHLVASLAFHAGWSLELACSGDLRVDDHHSAEDCALALGEALSAALAAGGRFRRFGSAYAPLDEALARAVVDLAARPFCRVSLGLGGCRLGDLAGENVEHFVSSLAIASRSCVHLDLLEGVNAHHKAEAAFKALALALREACALDAVDGGSAEPGSPKAPSAKGTVALERLAAREARARAAGIRATAARPRIAPEGGI